MVSSVKNTIFMTVWFELTFIKRFFFFFVVPNDTAKLFSNFKILEVFFIFIIVGLAPFNNLPITKYFKVTCFRADNQFRKFGTKLSLERYSKDWIFVFIYVLDKSSHRSCTEKFGKFLRETLLLESLFNKVVGLKACNFIKKRLQHRFFL